jgi:methylthioribose-1-phosphate isomerase
MTAFFTLRWLAPDAVELLDQRLLPRREHYLHLRSADEVAEAIRTLAVRGAPAIGCAAAYGVAVEAVRCRHLDASGFASALQAAFAVLAASRPTAVNLFWALARMRTVHDALAGSPPIHAAAKLLDEAHAILAADVAANEAMGRHGAALVPDGATILTHCNAGALATAGHGTALGVIRSAVAAGKKVRVFADETRPVLQGARLTAWELSRDGIPVTLLPDGAAGHLMATEKVDLVVVGADRIAANGDVANKIGTYQVAVMAHRHGVPFYVAAPLSTFDFSLADGRAIPIEQRDASEVTGYGAERWAPDGVGVFNPAFDVTPADLVSAIITEAGVVHRPDTQTLARLRADAATA